MRICCAVAVIGFLLIEDPEIEDCNFFIRFNISFCINDVAIGILVPAFLGVVMAGMIDATCINECSSFYWTISEG